MFCALRAESLVIFQSALDALSSVLFAAPCRICDQPLLNASRIPICAECLASFAPIGERVCPCCGRLQGGVAPVRAESPEQKTPVPLCRLCRAGKFAFARARSWA